LHSSLIYSAASRFGYLLVKIFLKTDIRTTGSGNIGATNVARSGAKWLAILTLLLEYHKVVFASLAVMFYNENKIALFDSDWITVPVNYAPPCLAALFAVLGHMFPVWLKFKRWQRLLLLR